MGFNHLLGQRLWFDEDIEVCLFQLFSYHLKNFWCKSEVSQVVNEKLKQQLEQKIKLWFPRAVLTEPALFFKKEPRI